MLEQIVFFDFDGQYQSLFEQQRPEASVKYFDLTAMPGTNGYCDEEAGKKLRELSETIQPLSLRFFGSGNYHYMSRILMERTEYEMKRHALDGGYELVLFDHHPDLLGGAFGGLLSCGGWVLDALSDFTFLRRVSMIGTDPELFRQAVSEAGWASDRVRLLSSTSDLSPEYPVYLSIDKDVLCPLDAATDWDQGTMRFDTLLTELSALPKDALLAADVCGEKKASPTDEELARNLDADRRLCRFFKKNFFDVANVDAMRYTTIN